MNNYEAIMKMDYEQLAFFLDNVYCTGLSDGRYFARYPDEEKGDCPFDIPWLLDDAEPAVQCLDGDELLEAFTRTILRNTGTAID